jgi:DNA-binding response OmpR family regulator
MQGENAREQRMSAAGQPAHIVVVEDEPIERNALATYLTRHGYRVSTAGDGTALRRVFDDGETADLVLLDVHLPGEDGFSLARELRVRSARLGIIMVTGATDLVDRVAGLETGADDYIGKPFEPRELLARVKSVLRRAGRAAPGEVPERVRMGRCVFDLTARVLIEADGTEQALTAMEFDLLKVFVSHPNRPLKRDWLLEVTSQRDLEPFDRSIDLRITRLRRKIEIDPAKPEALRTVRGVGYMFAPPAD